MMMVLSFFVFPHFAFFNAPNWTACGQAKLLSGLLRLFCGELLFSAMNAAAYFCGALWYC